MEFKSQGLKDLTLDLINKDGVQKKFETKEPVSAKFINMVTRDRKNYIRSQEALPESEKDIGTEVYIKMLTFLYDLSKEDIIWISEGFSIEELENIASTVMMETMFLKKKSESSEPSES